MIRDEQSFLDAVGGAAVCFLPFLALLAVLFALGDASAAEFQRSDPLVRFFGYPATTVATLVGGIGLCLLWWRRRRPGFPAIRASMKWAVASSAAVALALAVTAAVHGPKIPSFIPPEESAEAGLLLGQTAGMFEEVVFRLLLLPLAISLLGRRLPYHTKTLVASLAIGILFAASHELAGAPFQFRYFATRLLVPGFGMSLAFTRVHPAALLSAHATAHIVIALLFTSQ